MPAEEELLKVLLEFSGKMCWSVISGSGTGSMVNIDCGQRIERPEVVNNDKLSEEQRKYYGEYGLQIEDAAWRIYKDDCIIASWLDSNAEGEWMGKGLEELVGKYVRSARVVNSVYDLNIEFDGGITLVILCDQVKDKGANYTVSCGSTYYAIKSMKRRVVVAIDSGEL